MISLVLSFLCLVMRFVLRHCLTSLCGAVQGGRWFVCVSYCAVKLVIIRRGFAVGSQKFRLLLRSFSQSKSPTRLPGGDQDGVPVIPSTLGSRHFLISAWP